MSRPHRKHRKKAPRGLRKLLDSGKKVMTVWLLVNATAWVYLTYALAWTGHSSVVEDLSKAVVVTILGTLVTYSISSTVEHVSESKRGSILSAAKTVADMQAQEAEDVKSDIEYSMPETTISESEESI